MTPLMHLMEGRLARVADLAVETAGQMDALASRLARLEATVEAHSAAIAGELGPEVEG